MMAVCGNSHKELNEHGYGKCSVPMWSMGMPAGFCDERAFGVRPDCETFRDWYGEINRMDGKYAGHVPYLPCPGHGGPECPGVEIEPDVFSGCDQPGGDCPVCGK